MRTAEKHTYGRSRSPTGVPTCRSPAEPDAPVERSLHAYANHGASTHSTAAGCLKRRTKPPRGWGKGMGKGGWGKWNGVDWKNRCPTSEIVSRHMKCRQVFRDKDCTGGL